MPDHAGAEIYVDPPQLVTAGRELAQAGEALRGLRGFASGQAAAGIRDSGACRGWALTVFEESWHRYSLALMFLEEIVQDAGSHTLAAVAHYTDADQCAADWIGGAGNTLP